MQAAPLRLGAQLAAHDLRLVIKVPGGTVLRGCKKTQRKLMAHFQLRAGGTASSAEDPVMLQQLQVFCMYFANTNILTPYNQLQRRLGRANQNKHFSLKPAFDDPSNQELLAKLQQLGSANFTGDHNTISHHSMQLAVAMQQHYSNPGKARLGWSGEEAQLFIKLTCGYSLNTDSPELQAAHLDKAHVNDLIEEAAKQRRLL
ncbi:hypothetical protein HaLaN_29464, partial [Haematococcus lacustris]